MEEVVLVNEKDAPIGSMEKLEAHQKGVLHRAFSILLYNDQGELLLQKRAADKYHSGGLWTNTCCSHPRPQESTLEAAQRRLTEEMGIDVPLKQAFSFIYKIDFDSGLTEHELDHVFIGTFNGEPILNPAEASEWKYTQPARVMEDIKKHPDKYTFWFRLILSQLAS